MHTKLLFTAVLSFVIFSGLQAQNAELIKTFGSSSATFTSTITPFSAVNGKIYQMPEENGVYYLLGWDTTNTASASQVSTLGNQVPLSTDIEAVGTRLVYTFNTSTVRVLATTSLTNFSIGGAFDQVILGKASIHKYLARDIGDSFFTYDENNNRAIRFVPDAAAPRGFVPDYEVSLSNVTGSSADVLHFGVWDKKLYIVNSADNTIYRTDSAGVVTATYNLSTENPIPGKSLEVKRISVESNGRIVLLAKQTASGAAKLAVAGTSQLLFFKSDLELIGNLEIPASSSRGDFTEDLSEIDVDEDGNIYLGELGKRSITMLDYYNHAPVSPDNSVQGIFEGIVGDTVTIPRSLFAFQDLNTNDSLHSVKLYNHIGGSIAQVYFDENENGLFETTEAIDAYLDTVVISARQLAEGRLKVAFDPAYVPAVGPNLGELIYAWSDGISFSEYKGSLKFNTYSKYITINGTQGKDGWRIMTSFRDGEVLSEFLEPVWTQGAEGSDHPEGQPNVFSYHSPSETWVAITDLNTALNLGDAFAIYLFEDDEQFIPGIQGGWPKQLEVNPTKDALPHGQEFTLTLNNNTELNTPSFQGFNLAGNPYGVKLYWRTGVQLENASPQIAYWNSSLNNGDGGYVYGNLTNGSVLVSYGQGFWLQALGFPATVGFNDATIQNGSSVVPKAVTLPKITLRINDENYTDEVQFYSSELAAFSPKLKSLSNEYHEIYTLREAEGSKPFAVNSVKMEEELRIPIGIRSTRFEKASISLVLENLQETYSKMIIHQKLDNGNEVYFDVTDADVEIPLIKKGAQWKHEGELTLVLSNSELVSREDESEIPENLTLSAYPNPFNPTTNLEFSLPEASNVTVEVFNMVGQKVATLLNRQFVQAGTHSLKLDLSNQASGIYLIQIHTQKASFTRKISLIK